MRTEGGRLRSEDARASRTKSPRLAKKTKRTHLKSKVKASKGLWTESEPEIGQVVASCHHGS